MKQLKITVPTFSAAYGRLEVGDVVRCGEVEAKEFVEDLRCAVYDDQKAAAAGGEQKE